MHWNLNICMQSINIAIFHHHLNRGGVSSVILNQLSALNNRAHDINIKVAIFYGGRTSLRKELLEPFQDLNLELVELPGLEYDSLRNDFSADHQLADVIEKELARRDFDKSNSVLHFHNHSLGKSRAIVPAINQLAKSGHRIFLQIHDMAEDFRADNYHRLKSELPHLGNSIEDVLPTASQIRYGVINRRDEEILERTGIPSPSICYLPNSVSANEALTDQETAKRAFAKRNQIEPDIPLFLYPVRGIRRKNIGEAVLLTLLSREPICVGVTLSPINPIENESYQGWKELSADLRLPVLLELGEQDGVTFLDNVAAADAILTTSIAEGFGLVFLESFVFGKPLIGRDIPLITSDFKQSGVKFERLYSELQIPIALINLTDFDHQLRSALGSTYSAFGRELESNEYENHLSQILQTGSIDFARLTVVQQRAVITSAARDPRVRKMLQDANPAIADWISCGPSKNDSSQRTTIEQSKAIIEAKYSDLGTGNKLFSIYTEMLADDPSEVQSNGRYA
jgi:glycosyltransferase involved in cell wall biosynthesis